MNYVKKIFNRCAKIALPKSANDFKKNFWLASIGIRFDGCEVSSRNAIVNVGNISWNTSDQFSKIPPYMKIAKSHSEVRCVSKMDQCGTLFVVRISKEPNIKTGIFDFKMACPCDICSMIIKSKKISRVYYTINNDQYGIRDIDSDNDLIKEF